MFKQDKLINKINNLTLDSLPHSIILIGEEGSGRHCLYNILINKFMLNSFDITSKISLDLINEIYEKIEPYFYLVDLDKITIKNENVILKILEEPFNNAYFVLLSSNKTNIIPTILNRCQIWELEKYTDEDLMYFLSTISDNYPDYFKLIDIFKTPGQLLCAIEYNSCLNDMIKLSDLFIEHIATANFANTLTISNKIAFKDEKDKWNYDIFIKILFNQIKKALVDNFNKNLYYLYIVTDGLVKDSKIAHINKQHLFENYMITCKLMLLR